MQNTLLASQARTHCAAKVKCQMLSISLNLFPTFQPLFSSCSLLFAFRLFIFFLFTSIWIPLTFSQSSWIEDDCMLLRRKKKYVVHKSFCLGAKWPWDRCLPDCTVHTAIQSTSKWISHQWLNSSCHRYSNWQKFSVFSTVLPNIHNRKETHTHTNTSTNGQLTLAVIGRQLCPPCIGIHRPAEGYHFHFPYANHKSWLNWSVPPANCQLILFIHCRWYFCCGGGYCCCCYCCYSLCHCSVVMIFLPHFATLQWQSI